MSTVILYGPPASGKTHNAAEIAKVYACTGVIDEWDNTQGMGYDHLHITRMDYSGATMAAHDNATGKLSEVICVSIYDALKAVGATKFHTPQENSRSPSRYPK